MSSAASRIRRLWFPDTRVEIRVSYEDGTDRISTLEHQGPHGFSPPLHIRRNEDKIFHVLEGGVRFLIGGNELPVGLRQTVIAPKGTPHACRVVSSAGARRLTVTVGEDFGPFVRSVGRPAEPDGLPDPSGPPTFEQPQALPSACLRHGIEIAGPPLA